jgi:hypothetical protein
VVGFGGAVFNPDVVGLVPPLCFQVFGG